MLIIEDNPNLIYAVLRSHQDFQALATFTLVSGLREIQRRKAMRASGECGPLLPDDANSTSVKTKKSDEIRISRTNSELDMVAEKAALLGREGDEDEPTSPMEERRPSFPINTPQVAQPLTSPGTDHDQTDPLSLTSPAETPELHHNPAIMSEKARGKMRATESVTSLSSPTSEFPDIPDEELLKVAAAGVGPNGYVPTQEWVSSWQKGYVRVLRRA